MYVLNYWHTVSDYGEWKKVFDADPLDRKGSGMLRLTIERPLDDEHQVIAHLEFDSLQEAKTFGSRLQETWDRLGSDVVSGAGQRITEILVEEEYVSASSRRAA